MADPWIKKKFGDNGAKMFDILRHDTQDPTESWASQDDLALINSLAEEFSK